MKLFFDMQIVDEHGKVHGRTRREIDERAAFIGGRQVSELRIGADLGIATMSMPDTIEMMRVREFRKSLLTSAASQCGAALAEHLEDREGWHGIERQERIEASYGR